MLNAIPRNGCFLTKRLRRCNTVMPRSLDAVARRCSRRRRVRCSNRYHWHCLGLKVYDADARHFFCQKCNPQFLMNIFTKRKVREAKKEKQKRYRDEEKELAAIAAEPMIHPPPLQCGQLGGVSEQTHTMRTDTNTCREA